MARIFPVALVIAAGVPPDGLVLKPCPEPKRFSSAGRTLTSSAGTPSSSATSAAYSDSLPSASVVRLSTIFPVGMHAQEYRAIRLVSHLAPPIAMRS